MNWSFFRYFNLFLIAPIFGCSEYDIRKIPEKPLPEIEVTPTSYDYGNLGLSESSNLDIVIKNIGNDTLSLDEISLIDLSGNFNLYFDEVNSLEPGEKTTVSVSYSPIGYASDHSMVKILSNDRDESELYVNLVAHGDAPMIRVTPEYHDFGSVYLGCEESIDIKIENIGSVDLEIYDIDYLASIPADIYVNDFYNITSSLPSVLAPQEFIDLTVDYIPLDLLNDSAYMNVHSSDPQNPIVSAQQYALGEYENFKTDIFNQDQIVDVDILFVVDNSGSMRSNQSNLINNFSSFIGIFSSAGASYKIAFITTDSSEFAAGMIITEYSPDPAYEADYIINSIGTLGNSHERGIDMAYSAIDSGGDASLSSGFLREDARFVLIFISDEKDNSTLYAHSQLSTKIESLKSSIGLVSAHAVAGDYPSGCSGNGSAEFGDGYYDVVSHFSGSFLSICSNDWGFDLDEIARDSIALNQFRLSEDAIPDSITVTVNGALEANWVFEESTNSVILSAAPDTGSEIVIDYSYWSC